MAALQLLRASPPEPAAHPPGPGVHQGRTRLPPGTCSWVRGAVESTPRRCSSHQVHQASENTCPLAKHCDHHHVDPPAGSPMVPTCGGRQGPCWSVCCFLSGPATPEQGCVETLPAGGDGPLAQSLGLTGPSLPPRRTLGSQPKAVFRGNCADEDNPVWLPAGLRRGLRPERRRSKERLPASDKGPQPPTLAQLVASPSV